MKLELMKPLRIDYILPEIFKNAVRATIESHPDASEASLPSVHVTIANNEVDFILRLNFHSFNRIASAAYDRLL